VIHSQTTHQRFASLEAFRGLAALAVIVFHAGSIAALQGYVDGQDPYTYWGKYGVHLFFCLSGFVICYAHFDDLGRPERGPHYLWRRWARIWPLYAVLTCAQVVFAIILNGGAGITTTKVVTSLLFLDFDEPPIIMVGWTLVHEAFFYLLFLVFLVVDRKVSAVGFILFLVVQSLIEFSHHQSEAMMGWVFHQLRWYFLSGVGAALLIKYVEDHSRKHLLLLAGIQIGIMLAGMLYFALVDCGGQLGFERLSRALLIQLLLLSFVLAEKKNWIKTPRLLAYLGRASYSIYLIHASVIHHGLIIFGKWNRERVQEGIMPVMVLLAFFSVIAGIIVFELLEKFLTQKTRSLKEVYLTKFVTN